MKMNKELERVKNMSKVSTSMEELARKCAMTERRVETLLAEHPKIKQRVLQQLKDNVEGKSNVGKKGKITLCDASALVWALDSCKDGIVFVPEFVMKTIYYLEDERDKKGKLTQKAQRAKKAINYILANRGKVKIVKALTAEESELLVNSQNQDIPWKIRDLLAIAIQFSLLDYDVLIKTRTNELTELAFINGIKAKYVDKDV